jgi:hypothetical protein
LTNKIQDSKDAKISEMKAGLVLDKEAGEKDLNLLAHFDFSSTRAPEPGHFLPKWVRAWC